MSEVEILKKAKEHGKEIDFIGGHIPEMVCHRDPNFVCSSTKIIRQFLGLPTDGSRRLRVIAFQRLVSIKELKEKDMLIAYLQYFFCEYHGKITSGAPLTGLRYRSLLFVEEGDPTSASGTYCGTKGGRRGSSTISTSPGSRTRKVQAGKTTRVRCRSWRWTCCQKRV